MDSRESKSQRVEESKGQWGEESQSEGEAGTQAPAQTALNRREWLAAAGGALLVPGTQQAKSAKPRLVLIRPHRRPVDSGSSASSPRACCT